MYMHVCVSLRSDGKPWGCTWGDYDYVYAILCRCRCYVRLVSAHIMFLFAVLFWGPSSRVYTSTLDAGLGFTAASWVQCLWNPLELYGALLRKQLQVRSRGDVCYWRLLVIY
jgi:hypothetical protein